MIIMPISYHGYKVRARPIMLTLRAFRIISFIVNLVIFLRTISSGNIIGFVTAYTNWGVAMCFISSALNLYVEYNPDVYPEFKTFTEVFLESTWCAQMVVLFVFWIGSILIAIYIILGGYGFNVMNGVYGIATHLVPAILTLLEIYMSELKFVSWHRAITFIPMYLSLIHICRCRRLLTCRSRWSPYH
eukprot:TRINITY_DN14395_c0_g1_i2.p1 TRINITY_DN14395_c0_g1~~TRINITY_DN14395_c0_g1_i2.p1  ORF type:complete len:188 (-),score=7.96 TRINITY_DN14395_c0_g1_i2:16-579(-)